MFRLSQIFVRTLLWDLVSKTAFWIPGLFEKTQEASPWAVSTRSVDSTALLVGLSAEVGGNGKRPGWVGGTAQVWSCGKGSSCG